MKQTTPSSRRGARTMACAVLLGTALSSGQAFSTEGIDAEADKILKSMSAYLGGLKSVSFAADIDFEILTNESQKLQFSSYSTAVLQRPSKLHIERKGMFADAVFIYDGQTLSLHGKQENLYAQLEAPGTIDDAILAYEAQTGLPAPGADLLFADPYAVLSRGVKRGIHVGTTFIDGIACHHLAFREDEVDWQLWVQAGDTPLPMKYVITSKWQTGAPQYEIRYRDWNTSPKISADAFVFTAPVGAVNLGAIVVNEMGELQSMAEGQ